MKMRLPLFPSAPVGGNKADEPLVAPLSAAFSLNARKRVRDGHRRRRHVRSLFIVVSRNTGRSMYGVTRTKAAWAPHETRRNETCNFPPPSPSLISRKDFRGSRRGSESRCTRRGFVKPAARHNLRFFSSSRGSELSSARFIRYFVSRRVEEAPGVLPTLSHSIGRCSLEPALRPLARSCPHAPPMIR